MSAAQPADLAVSATGLVADFHLAGLLTWADVHPAQHLCHLYGESDDRVALAAALAVRALRSGSLCVDLAALAQTVGFDEGESSVTVDPTAWPPIEPWLAALAASPAVTSGCGAAGSRPLRLVDGLLYLERYWRDQETVRELLSAQLIAAEPASGHPEPEPDRSDPRLTGQLTALRQARSAPLTIIAGGPGTGKTRVIAGIVAAEDAATLIALAAPTGKAAARMTESLRSVGQIGLTASTVHRLLGWGGSRTRFRHDRMNPLPHDLVIIDELSMVSMSLLARLLDALKPHARLVLVGDPDQLASVEAGAALADLVAAPALRSWVVRLTHNFRFTGAIQQLSDAIRTGDADAALAVLTSGDPGVALVGAEDAAELLRERCVTAGQRVFTAAAAGDPTGALTALDAHRLLAAHRQGPFGVQHWSRTVAGWLEEDVPGFSTEGEFYPGRPLLMTRNVPDLELFNGDTGVIIAAGARPQAAFATGSGPRLFSPYLLDGLASLHAMTIHKSQGSQFERVSVVLPPLGSPLLTRELLYTAVTRASDEVLLVGSPDAIRAAIERPGARTSGLAGRLTG